QGLHGAHKIGHFWSHVPNHEDRAMCKHCAEGESLEHILIQCHAPGQAEVWALTRALLQREGGNWPAIHLDDVLGLGPRARNLAGDEHTPESRARLWRIVVSEGAHLIWRLRCERVIGHGEERGWNHTKPAVVARWFAAVNARLRQDAVGTRHRYGRMALKKSLVLQTWHAVIAPTNSTPMPADWINTSRVLVGIDHGIALDAGLEEPP
ncbi:hypothetical protein FOMPIDRAFT_1133169, partial [Fomitopsis schrenkii]